jgi:hypothetical protein
MAKEIEQVQTDDLMEVLKQEGFTVAAVADVGLVKDFDLTDKADLINRPFVIVEVMWKQSFEYGSDYVVCRCLDANRNRFVFADGSTGIAAKFMELLENYKHLAEPIRDDPEFDGGKRYHIAIPVLGGLSENKYMTRIKNAKGEYQMTQATTYRLNLKG